MKNSSSFFAPRKFLFFSILLMLLAMIEAPFTASAQRSRSRSRSEDAPVLDRATLHKMDDEIEQAIDDGEIPGAVLWVEHGKSKYVKAYGDRALVPKEEDMTKDTIFDLASLTKVIAGTPAIMILIERGQVKLDEPVRTYIPEFTGDGREDVTVRELLTHTSGILPDIETKTDWHGRDVAVQKACAEKLRNKPGTVFSYSDVNLFLVGAIVERVSGMKLEDFVQKEIYQPLKMYDTGYLPPTNKLARIAPTEWDPDHTNVMLRGVVHDPTSRHMGGVAGHAGLFSTAHDLARYARMMLNEGTLDGVRIFKPETVRLMTSVQTPPDMWSRRGLGWDIDSGYSRPRGKLFPRGSYGHTGWTGTCIWIDPFSKTFFIFLSNRVHPDGKGNVVPLYGELGSLAAEAVTDFDFNFVPGELPPHIAEKATPDEIAQMDELSNDVPGVLNGIDVLEKEHFAPLKGMRVGLITNHTGTNRRRYSTIHLLMNAPDVKLKALFSPEHGLYGLKDEPVDDSVDETTGLPVYSLYGKHYAPTPEQLRGLDALVYDIQDVGCRFYTYISTLGLCMDAAGKAGVKFFVLDRVNPIDGVTIDGPMLTGKTSFVGYHSIPVRYGMTLGELAQMYKAERHLVTDLTVIKVEGWKRDELYDATALPWRNFSPNMRSETEAILYPGIGLLERTSLSVGRGTGTPWEIIGAPYIHDIKLAYELNHAGLEGVRFLPVRFTPTNSVFAGQSCAGVNIVLTDREHCKVVDVGVKIAEILNRLYPDQFNVDKMDVLMGNKATLHEIKDGAPVEEIRKSWQPDLDKFMERRAKYLLY
ncbi:MAG TPA: exo-beta-N-acetylmuramidase NamZ domain-containing protein [Verrucomicrobiae bacterium]|nr:exo-beta-N-acetylmuramidase NamZ domain-containing protein [Verrucomicrobiae bacterium]